MLPRVITCCAVLLDVTKSYYMLPSVVACNLELLHAMRCCAVLLCCPCYLELFYDVQCCYMLPSVITCCAVLLHVTKSYYMLCSVVKCYLELLHDVQCCYMLPRIITCCAMLLHVALCC